MVRHVRALLPFEWLTVLRIALARLLPTYQLRNPIMLVVYCGAILASLDTLRLWKEGVSLSFSLNVTFWLWMTVLFANIAETYAEELGKAQTGKIKSARRDVIARRLKNPKNTKSFELVLARDLERGDFFVVQAGDLVPADGQIISGIATIDESAITGESAPVIRESGSDRDFLMGGTRVLSDAIVARVISSPGESPIDHMLGMLEGARRQKTPGEMTLLIFLSATTLAFLISCATLYFFSAFTASRIGQGHTLGLTSLIALLVCLAPTTVGGLLSTIAIAGTNRLLRANVIVTSTRAVEAAGDVSVLLLDKTGTITHGNRQAIAFVPAMGTNPESLVDAALLASAMDETPEGKSVLALARHQFGIGAEDPSEEVTPLPFSAETRVSGAMIGKRVVLKGAEDVIAAHVENLGGIVPPDVSAQAQKIARLGGTPLLVSDGPRVLGLVHLKDVVKPGLKPRLAALRLMGVRSIMITGDNPLTAAAIASEAGVDDFIAEATPDAKLDIIRELQESGDVVAMVGDGTNDAPALAQADLALAMNTGTQDAKEASNMVDLDSDPTRLIEIVKIGKQLLMTRGVLTTFSIANDIAKYFTVLPAIFTGTLPVLSALNILHLSSPENGVLAALIFNALVIVVLIPLAFHGVPFRIERAETALKRNLFVYGLGGLAVPFIAIKLIDALLFLFKGA